MLLKVGVYRLVWFCCSNDCGCCCCGCNGNWKKGNPPLPRAYGICPFHILTSALALLPRLLQNIRFHEMITDKNSCRQGKVGVVAKVCLLVDTFRRSYYIRQSFALFYKALLHKFKNQSKTSLR